MKSLTAKTCHFFSVLLVWSRVGNSSVKNELLFSGMGVALQKAHYVLFLPMVKFIFLIDLILKLDICLNNNAVKKWVTGWSINALLNSFLTGQRFKRTFSPGKPLFWSALNHTPDFLKELHGEYETMNIKVMPPWMLTHQTTILTKTWNS